MCEPKCAGLASIITLTVILVVIFAVLLGVSFKDVEADEMALRWHTLSKQVAPDVYEQGKHHVWPGEEFILYKSRFTTVDLTGPRKVSVISRDGVEADIQMSFQYLIDKSRLRDVLIEWGKQPQLEEFIVRLAQDAVRTGASAFTAEEFYAQRAQVSDRIERVLAEMLVSANSYCTLANMQMKNLQLPKEFSDSITRKQTAEVDIIYALESERQAKLLDMQELRLIAENDKERMLISAEGRANATLSAALEEVKGINAEFTETAQMYREFRATTGLDSAHFVKGYLSSKAMERGGKVTYIFQDSVP